MKAAYVVLPAAAWLASGAMGQMTYSGRNGEVSAFCGFYGGPQYDQRYLTPDATHDAESLADGGSSTRPATSAGAQLDAAPLGAGFWLAEAGYATRGPAIPNGDGAIATGDSRDNWIITVASASCFTLRVRMNAACNGPNIPQQSFSLSGPMQLSDGSQPGTLSNSFNTPQTWDTTYTGTLYPGQYSLSFFGRMEGSTYPLDGSFQHSLSLTLGPPAFVSMPADARMCGGGSAVFEVVVAGGRTPLGVGVDALTYQWQMEDAGGWVNLTDGPAVRAGVVVGSGAGAQSRRYVFQNSPTNPASVRFRCLVSNACGLSASDPAVLRVSSSDFNGDGSVGTDADIEAFFACIAGNCCATCGSADFNADGSIGTDGDIESFFRLLGGGSC
jgi:hypothetical protein